MKTLNEIEKVMLRKTTFIFVIIFMIGNSLMAENLKEVIDLEGTWKFLIGDDMKRAEINYDDRSWDYVQVPGSWEKNGFINYDGYAWYRKSFEVKKEIQDDYIMLVLGYIDDVDEVYVNGQLIGASGVFPPLVRTAYTIRRNYPVPKDLLNVNGKNMIAVRVYDEYLDGGIYKGPVGFYVDEDNELLSQNLAGYWNFETTNDYQHDSKSIYGKGDQQLYVPGFWETQGFGLYDGSATYALNFRLDNDVHVNDDLVLVLGYIDDIDKVYLNGTKIGTVELLTEDKDNFYRTFRGYDIPEGLLNSTGENKLVVKVYDTGGLGGIYAGPVGIATEANYKTLKWNQKEPEEDTWYNVFKNFWD